MNTNISFSVSASGYLPLTYQWQSGSTMLSDNTRITGSSIVASYSSSLIINNVQLSDTGSYRVFVSNIVGGVTSSYAQLYFTITPYPPVIIRHPIDQNTYLEGTASFSASFSASAVGTSLSYQWISGSTNLVDGVRITGSNSASVIINNLQVLDKGYYQVLVSNYAGYVYSNTASLTIIGLTSSESFEEYLGGQTSSFGSGYGWSDNLWTINKRIYLVSQDDLEAYDVGQSSAFSSGSGFLGNWVIG